MMKPHISTIILNCFIFHKQQTHLQQGSDLERSLTAYTHTAKHGSRWVVTGITYAVIFHIFWQYHKLFFSTESYVGNIYHDHPNEGFLQVAITPTITSISGAIFPMYGHITLWGPFKDAYFFIKMVWCCSLNSPENLLELPLTLR